MKNVILIKNGLVWLPNAINEKVSASVLGTICSNLIHFGFVLSESALKTLMNAGDTCAKTWWQDIEPALKEVTGANRKMEQFVVYKNFPAEVLEMSQAEYWVKQILMYWGLPNELFTQQEVARAPLFEKIELKVLQAADSQSLQKILNGLLASPARWTDDQRSHVIFLIKSNCSFDAAAIPFKENMVDVVKFLIESGQDVRLKSATDVLRLGIGLSGGDVSQQKPSKFKSFSRSQRKFLLKLLERSSNLREDVARDKNKWKKFLYALHPNDYTSLFPCVCKVNHELYNGEVQSWNGKLETLLKDANFQALDMLEDRAGEFMRRLQQALDIYGIAAADAFIATLDKLTVVQLLKIRRYLDTINYRKYLTYAPKGNWSKLQIVENKKSVPCCEYITEAIDEVLTEKMDTRLPNGVRLDDSANLIKLQTSAAELAPYGRGTVFPIPDNIKFIRSASYWKTTGTYGHSWFDNGWNFFGENWTSLGACCWNSTFGKGAVFSGDPTNGKEMQGRACQMIDLYIDKLLASGVRYAVWNVLCFSRIMFSQADDVFAALQWGEEPQSGKLFEPSRCQIAFPLKSENFTKYVAYIDLKERKLVYIDANLKSSTTSAASNCDTLQKQMPAFVEYLETLPSVYDLFKNVRKTKNGTVVSYTDKDYSIKDTAYIFKPVNGDNKFEQLNLSELLG